MAASTRRGAGTASGPKRRTRLLGLLHAAKGPVAGGRLAQELGVSRQVIVQDVALLRADGKPIVATSRGYVLGGAGADAGTPGGRDAAGDSAAGARRVLKMRHTVEQTTDELLTIVELGGRVLDVFVNHRVYGRISAPLGIATPSDVMRFADQMASGASTPLLTVTSGYHYHTIAAHSTAALDAIERALDAKGYLAPPR